MITDEEIVGTALEAGFMLSTQYGQAEFKQMPVSDIATLRDFAERFYQLGRQHQRESDAMVCEDRAEQYEAIEPFACQSQYSEDRACAEAIRNNTGDLK